MMMVRYAMTRNSDYHWLTDRRAGWLTFYGRLRSGVKLGGARSAFAWRLRRHRDLDGRAQVARANGREDLVGSQTSRGRHGHSSWNDSIPVTISVQPIKR